MDFFAMRDNIENQINIYFLSKHGEFGYEKSYGNIFNYKNVY